jgi:hypothetical protein
VCFDGCQQKVAKLYVECDGVCLPPGYYYDVGAGESARGTYAINDFTITTFTLRNDLIFTHPCADKLLDGCWSDAKPSIKIHVERCGCDAAAGLSVALPTTIIVALSTVALAGLFYLA